MSILYHSAPKISSRGWPVTGCTGDSHVSSGLQHVQHWTGTDSAHTIYMDDRSFLAKPAEKLVEINQCWSSWSNTLGLKEKEASLVARMVLAWSNFGQLHRKKQ